MLPKAERLESAIHSKGVGIPNALSSGMWVIEGHPGLYWYVKGCRAEAVVTDPDCVMAFMGGNLGSTVCQTAVFQTSPGLNAILKSVM